MRRVAVVEGRVDEELKSSAEVEGLEGWSKEEKCDSYLGVGRERGERKKIIPIRASCVSYDF